jgi:hypothetical protein
MEQNDTIILGILAHFRHFRHLFFTIGGSDNTPCARRRVLLRKKAGQVMNKKSTLK